MPKSRFLYLPTAVASLLAWCPVSGMAQEQVPPPDLTTFPAARMALSAHRDGLASVAVRQIDRLRNSDEVPPQFEEALRRILVENLVRESQYKRALDEIGTREWLYWKGVALAGIGSEREALALLKSCASDIDHAFQINAALAAASIEKKAGRLVEASQILAGSLQASSKPSPALALAAAETYIDQGAYGLAKETLSPADVFPSGASGVLRAQADLLSGHPGLAADTLELLLNSDNELSSSLRSRAVFMLFDARIAMGENLSAQRLLKSFIETGAPAEAALQAADRLAALGVFETEDGQRQLNAWAESSSPALAATASFHLGLIEIGARRNSEAKALLVPLSEGAGPFALRAKLELVQLYGAEEDAERAAEEIAKLKASAGTPDARARIQFVEARGNYLAGEFVSATNQFSAAGEAPETAEQAAYNAALAALQAGKEQEFEERLALLPEVSGDASRSALKLERALIISEHARRLSEAASTPEERQAAAAQYKRASESLEEFLRDHAKHPRAPEAHFAQASLYLIAYFPSLSQPAREAVAAARTFDLTPEQEEMAAYLEFWIEENDREDPKLAVELAEAYLAPGAWAKSDRAPEVRMRQAEIHFRNGDYLAARLKFEQLVADYPDSELADTALFFAGRAAVLTRTDEGLEKALELWQRLVEKGSHLALPARRHQAQVRLRQKEQRQVIDLVDEIVNANPPPSVALLVSSLLLKGEAQAVLAGQGLLETKAATNTFEEVRKTEGASVAAIHESFFREAQAHTAEGDIDGAIEDYYSVVNGEARRASGGPPEYLWFYRAGFECIRLLLQKGGEANVDSAIAIAMKLAKTPGPRAAEANRRAELLKRENYRWD